MKNIMVFVPVGIAGPWLALAEAAKFVIHRCSPFRAFAAATEFRILSKLSGVRIGRIAVQGVVDWTLKGGGDSGGQMCWWFAATAGTACGDSIGDGSVGAGGDGGGSTLRGATGIGVWSASSTLRGDAGGTCWEGAGVGPALGSVVVAGLQMLLRSVVRG